MAERRGRLDQPKTSRRTPPVRYDPEAFGRLTERIARFLGTGRYLILQTVLGFDAATIASAFLVSSATMGQRLVRAKSRIREIGIPFRVPERAELGERLDTVLEAIYAAFAEGWTDPAGTEARRRNLAEEGIWLGRLAVSLMPEEAEALGLLALMLFAEARLMGSRHERRRIDQHQIMFDARLGNLLRLTHRCVTPRLHRRGGVRHRGGSGFIQPGQGIGHQGHIDATRRQDARQLTRQGGLAGPAGTEQGDDVRHQGVAGAMGVAGAEAAICGSLEVNCT